MLKFNHRMLIILSGSLWLAVGLYLMPLGLNLIVACVKTEAYSPLMTSLGRWVGGLENSAILIVAAALLIGYFKGRKVFAKTAVKNITRILSLPQPSPISNIYGIRYCLLLVSMMGLGMGIKFFGVPSDIRGLIDTAVGSALINGSMVYFRGAFRLAYL